MKAFLLALALVLVSSEIRADYLGVEMDNNPEITIEDMIIKNHEITSNAQNCFTTNCAYEFYIRNQRNVNRWILHLENRFGFRASGVGVVVRR